MRISASAPSIAINETELMMNTQPEPTMAMSTPATAGPMSLAELKEAELSATAFESCSAPTRSETKAWREGVSKAFTMPSASAKPYRCQSCAWPSTSKRPRPAASSIRRLCVTKSTRRLSKRSATAPLSGTSSSCGPNCSAMVTPTATALLSLSSVSTTQFCAVACIHAPMFDTNAPKNQTR